MYSVKDKRRASVIVIQLKYGTSENGDNSMHTLRKASETNILHKNSLGMKMTRAFPSIKTPPNAPSTVMVVFAESQGGVKFIKRKDQWQF